MNGDRRRKLNDNLRVAFERLAEHASAGESRQFGRITAVAAGVPIAFFNRVFVFEAPARDDVAAAMAWLSAREVPFLVTAPDGVVDAVSEFAADLDLVRSDEPQPGMVLPSLAELPKAGSVADIAEVADASDLDAFVSTSATAFDLPTEVARRLTPATVLTADGIRPFVGRVNGEPVACGLLVASGDVAGVYNVGVEPEFRRRGIGEAMTWTVLRAGREEGCRIGGLQSSEMGYPVYEKMGFETVVQYHQFEPGG